LKRLFQQNFRGKKSGVSLRYFYMLLGSEDNIKPDRMIMRFIHQALGRTPNVCRSASVDCRGSAPSASRLPAAHRRAASINLIWEFQRTQ